MSFTDFIDIIGANAGRAPLVAGGVRAYYATGSQGIEETAAQIAAARAAGMGIILIDQTPSLSVFAAGIAAVADVEPYAGTDSSAHAGVAARQARGEESSLYVSFANWPALKADIASPEGVRYWIANWSWSLSQSEQFLDANADCVAVQYGSPSTNPDTLVPGTSVTLADVQADIDVATSAWADQFLAVVKVPKLVGVAGNQAMAELAAVGLRGHLSSTAPVVSQTPGAGAIVKTGSTVDLGL